MGMEIDQTRVDDRPRVDLLGVGKAGWRRRSDFKHGGQVTASQLPIALVGYLTEGLKGWPPSFEDAHTDRLERLGHLVTGLGLDADSYDRLVNLARRVIARPIFPVLRRAIANAAIAKSRLESDDIHEVIKNLDTKGTMGRSKHIGHLVTPSERPKIEYKTLATTWYTQAASPRVRKSALQIATFQC